LQQLGSSVTWYFEPKCAWAETHVYWDLLKLPKNQHTLPQNSRHFS